MVWNNWNNTYAATFREKHRERINRLARERWWRDLPFRRRRLDARLMRLYGITMIEREALIEKQERCCALCKKPFPEPVIIDGAITYGKNHVNVDHCHSTGRVRGMLCNYCNNSLGRLGDTQEMLQRAVDYVSEPADPDCF